MNFDEKIILQELIKDSRYKKPFEFVEKFNEDWWHGSTCGDSSKYYSVVMDNVEVGRVELDPCRKITANLGTLSNGMPLPIPADDFVLIVFFEVHEQCRRKNIGTHIIKELYNLYPNRTFGAFSEKADVFWGSLGWVRVQTPEFTRTFYFSPDINTELTL